MEDKDIKYMVKVLGLELNHEDNLYIQEQNQNNN